MTDPVLTAEGLTKSFGGLTAVDDVSIAIQPGEITGLIGPNGAGKSTLFNLLSGFLEPDTGAVYLQGKDVTEKGPAQCSQSGLVRTFQISRELTGMTVEDNMRLAAKNNPNESLTGALSLVVTKSTGESETRQEAERLLRELELWEVRNKYAGNLSGGQRKLLEFGRTLMTDPDILLLDEPMAGINPRLTEDLLELIRSLNERGMTFLVVEHDIDLISSLSDRIIAMVDGAVLIEGPPEKVQQNQQLLDAYLGG